MGGREKGGGREEGGGREKGGGGGVREEEGKTGRGRKVWEWKHRHQRENGGTEAQTSCDLFRAMADILYLVKRLPQQQATCTSGPSLPRASPAPTASTMPRLLTSRVQAPRYPLMMNPLRIVFT